jgi:hypothetical protein
VEYNPKYSPISPSGESLIINALVTVKYPPDAIHHKAPTTYNTHGVVQEKKIIQLIVSRTQVRINIFLYPNLSANFPKIYPKNIPIMRKIIKTVDFVVSPTLYIVSITTAR